MEFEAGYAMLGAEQQGPWARELLVELPVVVPPLVDGKPKEKIFLDC